MEAAAPLYVPMPARPVTVVLVALLGIAGCATQAELTQQKEDMLAAAGFSVIPANTPERKQELDMLPPNQFVQRPEKDHMVYLYADPLVCGCLYVGDQKAWNTYKHYEFVQRIANQERLNALMYEQAGWRWEPWGPGWWRY